MTTWPFSSDRLRAMYAGGRGDATARRFSRLWAAVIDLGLLPRRWVTLEVPGRRSGRLTPVPAGYGRPVRPVVPGPDARRAVQLGAERAARRRTRHAAAPTAEAALVAECQRLDVPVLIIDGADDLRPRWAVDSLEQALPPVTRVVLPRVGHVPWLEAPGPVSSLVLEFLRGTKMVRPAART